eukprot:jgi/Bigna1/132387/aug1.17_g7095
MDEELRKIDILKKNMADCQEITDHILGILASFENRLGVLSNKIEPIYKSTQKMVIKRKNIESTIGAVDQLIENAELARSAKLQLSEVSIKIDQQGFLSLLEKIEVAMMYFYKNKVLKDALQHFKDLRDALRQGLDQCEQHFKLRKLKRSLKQNKFDSRPSLIFLLSVRLLTSELWPAAATAAAMRRTPSEYKDNASQTQHSYMSFSVASGFSGDGGEEDAVAVAAAANAAAAAAAGEELEEDEEDLLKETLIFEMISDETMERYGAVAQCLSRNGRASTVKEVLVHERSKQILSFFEYIFFDPSAKKLAVSEDYEATTKFLMDRLKDVTVHSSSFVGSNARMSAISYQSDGRHHLGQESKGNGKKKKKKKYKDDDHYVAGSHPSLFYINLHARRCYRFASLLAEFVIVDGGMVVGNQSANLSEASCFKHFSRTVAEGFDYVTKKLLKSFKVQPCLLPFLLTPFDLISSSSAVWLTDNGYDESPGPARLLLSLDFAGNLFDLTPEFLKVLEPPTTQRSNDVMTPTTPRSRADTGAAEMKQQKQTRSNNRVNLMRKFLAFKEKVCELCGGALDDYEQWLRRHNRSKTQKQQARSSPETVHVVTVKTMRMLLRKLPAFSKTLEYLDKAGLKQIRDRKSKHTAAKSTLGSVILSFLDTLLSTLDDIAQKKIRVQNQCLAEVFRLNNLHHLSRKVLESKVVEGHIGRDLFSEKYIGLVNQARERYITQSWSKALAAVSMKEDWNKIEAHLTVNEEQGEQILEADTWAKTAIKKKLKEFNHQFGKQLIHLCVIDEDEDEDE